MYEESSYGSGLECTNMKFYPDGEETHRKLAKKNYVDISIITN